MTSKIELWRGDCLELMKRIPDGSVDFILTDPPYQKTSCAWDIMICPESMWKELKRVIKPNGAICLFGVEPFSSKVRLSNEKMFKYDWYWHKPIATNFLNATKQPLRDIETVSVFYSKQCSYFPQMSIGKPYVCKQGKSSKSVSGDANVTNGGHITINNGERYPKQLFKFNNSKGLHPTQKPVALLEYLIKTYTLEGETVLDFTAGSFSTGVAAVNLNRSFIGIELDKDYFEIGKKRVEDAQRINNA